MISFQGFKPSGIEKIANAMGFQGEEKDFQKFLEENPDRQAEMMRYQDIARKMVEGGYVKKMAFGGLPDNITGGEDADKPNPNIPKKKDIRDISSSMVTSPKLPVGAKATPFGIPTGDAGQMISTGSGQVGTTAPKATTTKAFTQEAEAAGKKRRPFCSAQTAIFFSHFPRTRNSFFFPPTKLPSISVVVAAAAPSAPSIVIFAAQIPNRSL